MNLVLDTNAYSEWRRSGRWNEAISRAEQILLPTIVLGELRYGFAGLSREREHEEMLQEFLREPVVRVLSVDQTTTICYAHLKRFLRLMGRPIPENDLWIAALVMEHGFTLVTADAHFALLPQIARLVE